jgi:tetratricopeptide (TPR) repeat protein
VDQFEVPDIFKQAGYTPQTIENQVVDQVVNIESHATTLKETFALPDSDSMPDIEVPATKLSFKAVVQLLQDFLGREPFRISGEIALVPAVVSAAPDNHEASSQRLSLTVRLTHSTVRTSRTVEVLTTSPQAAIRSLAQEVLRLVNPFILGMYAYEIEHDSNKAIELFHEAIRRDPTFADPYNDLGIVLFEHGDVKGAIEQYDKAIELDPKSAVARNNLGNALTKLSRFDEALEQLRLSVQFDPKKATTYYNWGVALLKKHELNDAIPKFERAIDIDPNYTLAYLNLGTALGEKGDYDGAIINYQKVIARDPENPLAYYDWGMALLYGKHDANTAIAKMRKAIDLAPKVATLHVGLGDALLAQGDVAGALASYQDEENLGEAKGVRGDPILYNNWGEALRLNMQDFDGAIEKYGKAVEIDPNYGQAYANWGNALIQKHDWDGAITQYQKAVTVNPGNPEFRNVLRALEKGPQEEQKKQP